MNKLKVANHVTLILSAAIMLITFITLWPEGKLAHAQGVPESSGSYLLRLVVSLPPTAAERSVYAIFSGTNVYALGSEGAGLYSLEAQASEGGAEIYITRAGAAERRDPVTWTTYVGMRMTVEVTYRINDVGTLELSGVAETIGRVAQVNGTPAAGDTLLPDNSMPSAQQPAAGATGGDDTQPAWMQTATATPIASKTITAARGLTATTPSAHNTTSQASPPRHTEAAPGANYLNTTTIIGSLVLLTALAVRLMPKLIPKLPFSTNAEHTEAQSEDAEQDNEDT